MVVLLVSQGWLPQALYRHSAKCKRRFAEFEARSRGESRTALDAAVSEEERLERERSDAVNAESEAHVTLPERTTPASVPVAEEMEVELDESLTGEPTPESLVAYERRFKRPSDAPTEQLEREMNEEVENRMDALETGLYWSDSGQPVLSSLVWSLDGPVVGMPATGPDMFDGSTSSIQFHGNDGHQCESLQKRRTQIQNSQPRSAERSKDLKTTQVPKNGQFPVSSN